MARRNEAVLNVPPDDLVYAQSVKQFPFHHRVERREQNRGKPDHHGIPDSRRDLETATNLAQTASARSRALEADTAEAIKDALPWPRRPIPPQGSGSGSSSR